MPAGRPPKLENQKTGHYTKDQVEKTEQCLPIYQSQVFTPPESLTTAELKVWNELVEIIRGTIGGYVSDADRMIMEVFCKAKVEYDRACKEWNKNPKMYVQVDSGGKDRDGQPKTVLKVNQWYQIKKEFSLIMTKYLDQLGISPLGRAKQGLQATKSKKAMAVDELKALFDRPED